MSALHAMQIRFEEMTADLEAEQWEHEDRLEAERIAIALDAWREDERLRYEALDSKEEAPGITDQRSPGSQSLHREDGVAA